MQNYQSDSGIGVGIFRFYCQKIVDGKKFHRAVLAVIIVNSVIVGLQTIPSIKAAVGPTLDQIDTVIVWLFVAELLLRFAAQGFRMFRSPWSVFDTIVVAISVIPATDGLSVLRTLRILRVLRTVSAAPRLRRVVVGLLSSLPGLGAVTTLLCLIFYVSGVIATELFGEAFPDWFGSLPKSVYSLFQIMTLESWSMGIVRPVMEVYGYAWLFFVPFIAISAFTMLNLFIAVVVNALPTESDEEAEQAQAESVSAHDIEQLRKTILDLQEEVRLLRGRDG